MYHHELVGLYVGIAIIIGIGQICYYDNYHIPIHYPKVVFRAVFWPLSVIELLTVGMIAVIKSWGSD